MTAPDDIYPPAAYIIGAPKCGTTALAAYLAEHPLVGFAQEKEPHFFSDDFAGLRLPADEAAYRAGFPALTAPGSILMEGSVFYLMSRTAVDAIQARRQDAKFIVMLRNPVEMAPSLHRQMLNSLDEDERDFETAWRLSDARGRGERIPKLCRVPIMIRYPLACALGEQVARLCARVPPERRLIMFQEELRADPGAVYRRALGFLGLPDDGRADFPRINEATAPRSHLVKMLTQRPWPWLHRPLAPIKRLLGVKSFGVMQRINAVNAQPTGGARVSETMAAELAAHFAPDVALLSRTLGRDLPAEFGWPAATQAATA